MKIEFIISSYKNPEKLLTMLGCLQSQTVDAWTAHVFRDGQYDGYEDVKNFFIKDERIKFTEFEHPHGDWGNTPRNVALGQLTQEWVVMTGHDNYYTPVFVEYFLREVTSPDVHFVFCDMIHSHMHHDYLKSVPAIGRIDIGNFMSRSSLASQMRINAKSTVGDGEFVVEYLQKFQGQIKYIPKALYIHN